MRDDPEFNINLVQEIEQHPCLYDYNREDYARKHIQDKAWKEVAETIGESVTDCKTRWRNLRGRYAKIKNQCSPSGSGAARRKPYYLTEYLHFVDKFCTSRPSKANIVQTISGRSEDSNNVPDYEDEEEQEDGEITGYQSRALSTPDEVNERHRTTSESDPNRGQSTDGQQQGEIVEAVPPPKKSCLGRQNRHSFHTSTIKDVNKALLYLQMKKQSASTGSSPFLEDPDAAFLFSLLPDIKKMEDGPKRKFKINLLQMVQETLDNQSASGS